MSRPAQRLATNFLLRRLIATPSSTRLREGRGVDQGPKQTAKSAPTNNIFEGKTFSDYIDWCSRDALAQDKSPSWTNRGSNHAVSAIGGRRRHFQRISSSELEYLRE